jgi:hypothetical protein
MALAETLILAQLAARSVTVLLLKAGTRVTIAGNASSDTNIVTHTTRVLLFVIVSPLN